MIIQPEEPEIMQARQSFAVAQASMEGVTPRVYGNRTYSCSWYGTSVDPERGSFAVVNSSSDLYGEINDPDAGVVGEFVKVSYNRREVRVYVIGSDSALSSEIALSRRAYMALEIPPIYPIEVYVSIIEEA